MFYLLKTQMTCPDPLQRRESMIQSAIIICVT